MSRIYRNGPLFIVIAVLLWSFDGVLRRGLFSLPPVIVVFYEHLLGLLFLLPLLPSWSKDLKKLTHREWTAIGVVGIGAGALGTIFYTAALGQVQYIQFSVVMLLQQLQPIWGISVAALLLKEKLHKQFLVWACIALVASYFVTFKELTINFDTGRGTLVAALLALGAGVMWGSSTALSKFVLQRVSFLTVTALRFIIAPLFAFFLIVSTKQTHALFQLQPQHWQSILLIVFSSGLIGLALYYYGLNKTQARVSSILELIWPASSVLIDYFYFHNTLSATQFIGICFLLLAIYKITPLQK